MQSRNVKTDLIIESNSGIEMPKSLVKSKKRVADHGEVFTPSWLVNDMLDLVKNETGRIDSRILEPACGPGNFLVQVLVRKLAAVERKYSRDNFEQRHHALHGLMCIYGIELLEDNIAECRANMLEPFAAYLNLAPDDLLYRAATRVLNVNLVHADALTMSTPDGSSIFFAEWAYRGRGRYQRRDFRFETMTRREAFSAEDTLFADAAKHEIFTPLKEHGLMTVEQIAEMTK
jgi:hypothetical protein